MYLPIKTWIKQLHCTRVQPDSVAVNSLLPAWSVGFGFLFVFDIYIPKKNKRAIPCLGLKSLNIISIFQ